MRIEGRVTATDRRFDSILLRYVKPGAASADLIHHWDDVSGSGRKLPGRIQ